MITRPLVVRHLTDRSVSAFLSVVTAHVWSGPCLIGSVMRPTCDNEVGVDVAVRKYRVV